MQTLTETETGIDRAFQALADEKRIDILGHLVGGERCVCELTDEAGLGQSLLSFHLRVLKDAGLVDVRRIGRWGFYSINTETVGRLQGFLGDLGAAVEKRSRCCGDPACECRVG